LKPVVVLAEYAPCRARDTAPTTIVGPPALGGVGVDVGVFVGPPGVFVAVGVFVGGKGVFVGVTVGVFVAGGNGVLVGVVVGAPNA
jgi:hypothetical protein